MVISNWKGKGAISGSSLSLLASLHLANVLNITWLVPLPPESLCNYRNILESSFIIGEWGGQLEVHVVNTISFNISCSGASRIFSDSIFFDRMTSLVDIKIVCNSFTHVSGDEESIFVGIGRLS